MSRVTVLLMSVGLVFGLAACEGGATGDDVLEQDTTLTTVEDTVMIERTTTVDTVQDPDLERDTLGRDTMMQDTMFR